MTELVFALSNAELGISGFTINLIFISSTFIALGLPLYFLLKKAEGTSAFSKF